MAKKLEITLSDIAGNSFTFNTLYSLKNFFSEESKFWDVFSEKFSKYKGSIHNQNIIYQSKTKIKSIHDYFDKEYNNLKSLKIDDLMSKLDADHILNNINSLKVSWISGSSDIAGLASVIIEKYNETVAYSYLMYFARTIVNQNDPNFVLGVNLATSLDFSKKINFSETFPSIEAKSFDELRSKFFDYHNELSVSTEDFKTKLNNWSDEKIEVINNFIEDKKSAMSALEKTYEEKLRLEQPVAHWKTRARQYQKRCWWNLGFLLTLLTSGIALFTWLFSIWLTNRQEITDASSLQGVAIFVVLLCLYLYAIRIFAEQYFSNLHISRDADEKAQLAYVYLSLMNNTNGFDSESRKIVLQSLFSRVETGLLGSDSSPAMPVQEIIKTATNHR